MKLRIYGCSDDLVEFELLDNAGKEIWSEEVPGDNCRFLISLADGPTLGVQAIFDEGFVPDSSWVLSVHYNFPSEDWPGNIQVVNREYRGEVDPMLEIELPADRESGIRQVLKHSDDSEPFTALFTPSLVVVDSNKA